MRIRRLIRASHRIQAVMSRFPELSRNLPQIKGMANGPSWSAGDTASSRNDTSRSSAAEQRLTAAAPSPAEPAKSVLPFGRHAIGKIFHGAESDSWRRSSTSCIVGEPSGTQGLTIIRTSDTEAPGPAWRETHGTLTWRARPTMSPISQTSTRANLNKMATRARSTWSTQPESRRRDIRWGPRDRSLRRHSCACPR